MSCLRLVCEWAHVSKSKGSGLSKCWVGFAIGKIDVFEGNLMMLRLGNLYFAALTVLVVFLLPTTHVHAQSAVELEEFKKAIRAKYDLMEQGWATDSPELIYDQFFADDARGLAADEPRSYKGRAQFKEMYDDVALRGEIKIESVDTFVNGDAGWDWANMHARYHDESIEPFTVMFLFLWSREDGEWMSKGEIYVVGEFDSANVEGQIYDP